MNMRPSKCIPNVTDHFFHFACTGDPYDIVKSNGNQSPLANWESIPHLTPLNLYYDITPPELVSAVVTEVAILPCTSTCFVLMLFLKDKKRKIPKNHQMPFLHKLFYYLFVSFFFIVVQAFR